MVGSKATFVLRRSLCRFCESLLQPPDPNLTVRSKFVGFSRIHVSHVFYPPSRHGASEIFSIPPFENGIQDPLSHPLEHGEIEVQHTGELTIELAVVRHDGAIG